MHKCFSFFSQNLAFTICSAELLFHTAIFTSFLSFSFMWRLPFSLSFDNLKHHCPLYHTYPGWWGNGTRKMWWVGESEIGLVLWWRGVNLWKGFWPLHCTVCEKIRCHYCTTLFGGVCKCWQGSGTKQLVMRTEAAAIQIDTSLQLSVDFCNRSRPPLKRQKYVDRGSIPNQLCRFPLDLASSFCQRGGMGELRTERKKERELPPDLGHRYLAHPPTFSLDEQAPLTERSKHILPTSLSYSPSSHRGANISHREEHILPQGTPTEAPSLSSQSKHLSVDWSLWIALWFQGAPPAPLFPPDFAT